MLWLWVVCSRPTTEPTEKLPHLTTPSNRSTLDQITHKQRASQSDAERNHHTGRRTAVRFTHPQQRHFAASRSHSLTHRNMARRRIRAARRLVLWLLFVAPRGESKMAPSGLSTAVFDEQKKKPGIVGQGCMVCGLCSTIATPDKFRSTVRPPLPSLCPSPRSQSSTTPAFLLWDRLVLGGRCL